MRKLFKHVSIPTFMGGVLFPVGSQCVGLRVVARIPGKAEMAYSSRTPTEAEKENCCIPGNTKAPHDSKANAPNNVACTRLMLAVPERFTGKLLRKAAPALFVIRQGVEQTGSCDNLARMVEKLRHT